MPKSLAYMRVETKPDTSLIGKTVIKRSGKPFKSTFKVATVKGYTFSKFTKLLAFTFEEDDSVVECFRCDLLDFVKDTVEQHTHVDKYGVMHTCYHECKNTFKQWGFWIGMTVGFPIEHFIWTQLPPFNYISKFIGLD